MHRSPHQPNGLRMEYLLALASLAVVHILAVISPGQSLLFITRTAMTSGRLPALAGTLGMAAGACFWAIAAMLGMAVILQQAAWAYNLLRIAGGLYLIYLAVMIWRHAPAAIEIGTHSKRDAPLLAVLRNGFLIQIANPKVVVFFGSIFFALLPQHAPLWVSCVAVLIVLFNEAAWYALVSLLFSSSGPRGVYMRMKPSFDRVMAGVLGMIGMKLIADTR
jgi:threonine/homoserine/homoserine lactone efflux protein